MANPNVPSIPLDMEFLLPFLKQQFEESQRQQGIANLNSNYATNRARDEASSLQSQLSSLMSAPEPQINPWAQLAANIGGGLSQIAAPQLGGQERAARLVEGEQATLAQRRASRLRMLEGAYERAAARADKLGDDAQHIKMLQAAERVSNNLKALNEAAITSSSDRARKQISQGENAARLEAERIRAAADKYSADQRRDEATGRAAATKLEGFVADKDWLTNRRAVLAKKADTPEGRFQIAAETHNLALTPTRSMANNPAAFAQRARTIFAPVGAEGFTGPRKRDPKKPVPIATLDEVFQSMIAQYQIEDMDIAAGFLIQGGYSKQEVKDMRVRLGR